jgi:hypothetical protein
VGIVLGLISVLLALVFVVIAVTKIGSGYWFGYLAIVFYGVGAVGCALAARGWLLPESRPPLTTPPAIAVAFGLAAVVLAVFAVRSFAFATTDRHAHSGDARPGELILVVLDGMGAAGSLAAARQCVARGVASRSV